MFVRYVESHLDLKATSMYTWKDIWVINHLSVPFVRKLFHVHMTTKFTNAPILERSLSHANTAHHRLKHTVQLLYTSESFEKKNLIAVHFVTDHFIQEGKWNRTCFLTLIKRSPLAKSSSAQALLNDCSKCGKFFATKGTQHKIVHEFTQAIKCPLNILNAKNHLPTKKA